MKQLIIALVIALLAVVFALQNAAPVTVNLYFWDASMSMALLVIILLVAGILTGALIMSKAIWSKNNELRLLKKQLKNTGTEPKQ